MQYGICNLGLIPLRQEADHCASQTSEVLYGEHFKILKQRKDWSFVRLSLDNYEGWLNNKQFQLIEQDIFDEIETKPFEYASDLVGFICKKNQILFPITLGGVISAAPYLNHSYEGAKTSSKKLKETLVDIALMYLNAPYLWGGKSPFGIDCSGFTQSVYRLAGIYLHRDAHQQANQGDLLSFIEESEAGDLAFFDDKEGKITHVGIVLENNHIIHAFGKVRIDRIDQTGIFNAETGRHTHKLRVIKKMI